MARQADTTDPAQRPDPGPAERPDPGPAERPDPGPAERPGRPAAALTDPSKVLQATGRSQQDWFRILDGFGLDLDHTQRARRLADAHPDLPGWWVQNLSVDFERARGLRVKGQTHKGDFQVSCSKTIPAGYDAVWQRVLTAPFLANASWQAGATWDAGEGRVEVRRADGGVLRWFWFDGDGRSTVTVTLQDKHPKTGVTFTHDGLASPEAVESYRARWKRALETIARA